MGSCMTKNTKNVSSNKGEAPVPEVKQKSVEPRIDSKDSNKKEESHHKDHEKGQSAEKGHKNHHRRHNKY